MKIYYNNIRICMRITTDSSAHFSTSETRLPGKTEILGCKITSNHHITTDNRWRFRDVSGISTSLGFLDLEVF